MKLTSDQFRNNAMIPRKYTCAGDNVNPPLNIEDIPENARSLALVISDPDAPTGTFVHWVMYDIPVMARIHEDSTPGTLGTNDFNKGDYGGPCPPSGTHRYYFKLYALDAELNLPEGLTKERFEEAIAGHVIAECELVGLFSKEARQPAGL